MGNHMISRTDAEVQQPGKSLPATVQMKPTAEKRAEDVSKILDEFAKDYARMAE